jgi:hypothetical protein
MLGALLRRTTATDRVAAPAPPRTSADRRRVLAEIAAEETSTKSRLGQLAAQIVEAREREVRARQELDAASTRLGALEAEQLADSAGAERRVADLRRQLAEGAPVEITMLRRDVLALVEHARSQVTTWLGTGFENVEGRRPITVSTNVDEITAFCGAAREVIETLDDLRYAEAPADLLEQLAPFVSVTLPEAVFERSPRHDEPPMLVSRVAIVPAMLMERFTAIGGVSSPTPWLSPAEQRQTEWDAETSLQRRWSGEPWR